jgi:putative transposase
MSTRHPPRLDPCCYTGLQRYFLTICCEGRRALLRNPDARQLVLFELRRTSAEHAFAVFAYCLMPDHLHLVVEAQSHLCDLIEFMRLFKQRTAYEWRQRRGARLWQTSFYDHVLRDAETTQDVVRYVLENPVRGRLVTVPEDYEHSGSLVYDRSALIEWAFGWQRAER